MYSDFRRLALTVTLCAVVVGCGGEQREAADRTIRFWHFWSEPGQRAALQSLVSEFETANNCRVELTELSWADGKVKLQAAFNSGQPPDVIELGSDWIAQFSSAGVLSELPGDGNAVGHFLPWSLEPARWKGRTYAYPWSVDARALFVNVDLVKGSHWGDRPITTLDELLTMSDDVQKTGQTGFGANGDDAHRLYKKILPIMWTMDGDVFDANGTCVLNSPANVNALNLYASLARTGMVETQRMIDAAFVQGRVGAIFSGSWLMKKLKSAPFRWRALPMPGNGTTPGVQFAGGEYLALAASSPKKGLAKQLIAFLTAGKNSVRFCRQVDEAGFPADTAFTNDSALIADPTKAVFARQLRSARMTPVHPRWLDVEAILEHAVVQVLYGTQTAEEALADAQQQVESLKTP